MRVMMVTKFLPLPANTGGKRRSLAIVERYLARGDELILVAHDDGTADIAALERRGVTVISARWKGGPERLLRGIARSKSAILGRFYTPALYEQAREVARAQPVDVLQIEYIHNCVYRDVVEAVSVLDLHDVASEQARKIATIQRPPLNALYWLESHAIARRERLAQAEYDVIACVSQHDAELLGPKAVIAPNGWDATAPLAPPHGDHCVFVANFAFSTNVDAAQWLVSAIWPKVRAELPDAQLWLVGKDPTPPVVALHDRDGITVTGTVPDVSPYLERSRVALAPLRAGSGSRLKILEALEAARPIVSTSAGLEGLEQLANAGVVLADDPDSFARAVVALLRDPARAQKLGEEGRRAVHQTFLWDRTLSPMFDAIDRAVAARRRRSAPSGARAEN